MCHSCCTHSVYLYIVVSLGAVIIIIQLWIKALESLFLVIPDILPISLQVFALICDAENPQVFTVEFIRGQIRRFSSTERYTSLPLLLVFVVPWVFVFQPHLLAIFHVSVNCIYKMRNLPACWYQMYARNSFLLLGVHCLLPLTWMFVFYLDECHLLCVCVGTLS